MSLQLSWHWPWPSEPRVPGEDEVDLARVVSAAPSGSWRKAIGG